MKTTTIRTIRTIIKRIMMLITIILLLVLSSYIDTHYTRDARVDKTEGLSVHFIDTTGRGWWYDGCYAEVGEEVKLIMYTNNTDNYVEDDIIKDIKFVDNK